MIEIIKNFIAAQIIRWIERKIIKLENKLDTERRKLKERIGEELDPWEDS